MFLILISYFNNFYIIKYIFKRLATRARQLRAGETTRQRGDQKATRRTAKIPRWTRCAGIGTGFFAFKFWILDFNWKWNFCRRCASCGSRFRTCAKRRRRRTRAYVRVAAKYARSNKSETRSLFTIKIIFMVLVFYYQTHSANSPTPSWKSPVSRARTRRSNVSTRSCACRAPNRWSTAPRPRRTPPAREKRPCVWF